jgi:hypothetical protein
MEERARGRPLSEAEPHLRGTKVAIYRACVARVTTFKTMDYVTRSLRWAIKHAQHVAAVEGEPAHVMRARVSAEQVFEADNPGEYFYGGPEIRGSSAFSVT